MDTAGRGGGKILRPVSRSGNQDGAEVIDIGPGGAGDEKIVQMAEEGAGIVVGKMTQGVQPHGAGAPQGAGTHDGTGSLRSAVNAVRVGGQRVNPGVAAKRQGQGQSVFRVAPSPAPATYRHGGFTTGQEEHRPSAAGCRDPAGQKSVPAGDMPRFALDPVT